MFAMTLKPVPSFPTFIVKLWTPMLSFLTFTAKYWKVRKGLAVNIDR